MILRHWRRWGRSACLGGALAAGLGLGWTATGGLPAQSPGVAPAQRIYMNGSVIDLPIKMDDPQRALIQEIQLYVKDSPTAPWVFRDKGNAAQTAFRFQAPRDGEFRFTMVTVDKQGRRFPQDLANEPPGLIVMIDTQKPVVQMKKMGVTPNGQLVQCEVSDANLDNAGMRFYFQGDDKVFRLVDGVHGQPGIYCIPRQAVSTGMVRLVAHDLAGNQTVCDEHLNQVPNLTAVAPVQPTAYNPAVKAPGELDAPKPLPKGLGSVELDRNPLRSTSRLLTVEGPTKTERQRPDGSEGPRFNEDLPRDGARPDAEPKDIVWITKDAAADDGPRLFKETEPSVKPVAPRVASAKRQLVNNTVLFLDYEADNAKSAGKVEAWLTRDLGKTWQKGNAECKGQTLGVHLPGEGLFGVALQTADLKGSPKGADAVDLWIEVDLTEPTAQITNVKMTQEKGQAHLEIHWTAEDKNLGAGPVDLFYAVTARGPWLPIAKGLPGQGQQRWAPSAEIGTHVLVRLIARDAAGNQGICNTAEPIALQEAGRPRFTIRNVRTEAPAPPQPVLPAVHIIQPPRNN